MRGAGRKQSRKAGWESGVKRIWGGESLGSDGLLPRNMLLSVLLIEGVFWVVSPLESLLWLR